MNAIEKRLAVLSAAVTVALLQAATAQAALTNTYYSFFGDGTNQGGSGNWDTTSLNWQAFGTTTDVVWPNSGVETTGSGAYFGGTGGIVTIDAGGVTVGRGVGNDGVVTNTGVAIVTDGVTLTGGPLTFAGLTTSSSTTVPLYDVGWGSGTGINTNVHTVTINNNTIIKPSAPGTAITVPLLFDAGATGSTVTFGGNIGIDPGQTATVTLNLAYNLRAVQGGSVAINGNISDNWNGTTGAKMKVLVGNGANYSGSQKNYSPVITLGGTNVYASGTFVDGGGQLVLTNGAALGSSNVTFQASNVSVFDQGSVLTGAAVTVPNNFYINAGMNLTLGLVPQGADILGGGTADISTYSGIISSGSGVQTGQTSGTHQIVLTAASGGRVNFTGKVWEQFGTSNGAHLSVVKIGRGVVNLSNTANGYTGGTTINDGTLLATNASGSGTGTGAVIVQGVTGSTATGATFIANDYKVTVASTSGLLIGQSVTGTNIRSGTVIASITDGTHFLLSNQALAASATGTGDDLTLGSTQGILGGTGNISGPISLLSGGAIAPGDASAGTLNGASLIWNGGGAMNFELGATQAASDELVLSGALSKGSAGTYTFNFTDLGGAAGSGNTYTLINFGSQTGFANTDFSANGLAGTFGLDGNNLTFTAAVPEPASFGLLAVSALALLRRRRNA